MAQTVRRSSSPDLWTRFIERAVYVVEALCPSLERSLSWDFHDCRLMDFEESERADEDETIVLRVRDLHEEMGDFLPHAASAA